MQDKQYICVAKCPELDYDDLRHCIDTKEGILEKEEGCCEYCPCGNIPIGEEFEREDISYE